MSLSVNWHQVDLEDFVPEIAELIGSSGILDAMKGYANAQKVIGLLNAAKFTPDDVGSISPFIAATNAFIATLDAAINDFFNTGVYFLAVPPLVGGATGFGKYLSAALRNQRDIRRPNFSDDAYITAFGGFAFSLDNQVTDVAFEAIKKGTIPKQEVQRALGVETLKQAPGFFAAHYKNLLASTARPLPQSPWISLKLADVIPGLEDILLQVKSILESLKNSVSVSSVNSFTDFVNRQADTLIALANQIQAAIDFIADSLEQLPLRFFAIPPGTGGTTELADKASSDFFNGNLHPEVADVQQGYQTTGFVLVSGSSDQASVQAAYDVMSALFGVS